MAISKGETLIQQWYLLKDWEQFPFQKEMMDSYLNGFSGLLNAPTGSGKTFAMFLPFLADYINENPETYRQKLNSGLMLLWITPLRALTNDIQKAMQSVVDDLGIPWKIGTRTGDTSSSDKQAIKRKPPEVLLTTPESLHLMLAQKEYPKTFKNLRVVVIDEWHELLGTKRGVQVELGLSRLKSLRSRQSIEDSPLIEEHKNQSIYTKKAANQTANNGVKATDFKQLKIWGISATIGNLEEAADVLLGPNFPLERKRMVRANITKKLAIKSIIPENVEKYSWSGHIGLKLLPQVMQIVANSKTTLIFTNTRAQSEIWYHAILDNYPEYAGVMAMHHGSLDNQLRAWVEEALHAAILKLVVCTSSLDLGVDFRPVDTVIQIGSPKGVARFMQRAGRSGHHPGATSKAYFVPTHSLELLEGAALKYGIAHKIFESRDPILLAYDVLIQYLVTLAVSDGFRAEDTYQQIINTFAYADLSRNEFHDILQFITRGGKSLSAYDEFLKVEIQDGIFKVNDKRVAMRHRLSMGTITGDINVRVKFQSGGSLGTVEEGFISKLKAGDTFWFAGRSLEFIRFKDMTAFVKKSNKKKGQIASWVGSRMPLSSQLSAVFREKLDEVALGVEEDEEVKALRPLFDRQIAQSHLPFKDEFLIETLQSRSGFHYFFYPFEGRLVHEGLASLFAYRITKLKSASFSIAMNDYGFELLTDEEMPLEQSILDGLFSDRNLLDDIQHSLNANEMARRKFRDIAHIAGLVFTGFPGKNMSNKNLQSNTSLLFDVFNEYEKDNLLIRQAYNEALAFQLEEFRMREALQRIQSQKHIIKHTNGPSPFAFPVMVDRLSREKLSTETLEERVAKMIGKMEADF
ncbi:ligase-associated DNA damage response DEXH box helicase [Pedobacter sp. SD-b]|uniref:Ligase-associated DNA damage response DEXH box helicase n=1 Tax=Pedobacter segetis TaxID=2793069 RepID=A0ABS1BJR7_9SPHI|nr:ligase-associated DNA damage response DEXH box helicase [Pedobacter segetis]MBK0383133.1 ligase-associated DNA damage response DEXH box helicase [Pedobacter segetis]